MTSVSNQWCAEKLSGFLKSTFKIESEDLPSDTSSLYNWLNWPDGKGGKYFTKIINPKLLYKGDIIFRDPSQDYIAIVYEGGSVSIKYKIAEGNSSLKKFIKKETTGPVSYILRARGARDDTAAASIPTGSGNVRYTSGFKSQTRNIDISPTLFGVLQSVSASTGINVVIFSGGQSPSRRTGSARHNAYPFERTQGYGWAADVWLYYNGRQLNSAISSDIPLLSRFVRECRSAGCTGAGMGPGYMGGVGLHIDMSIGHSISSGAATWGLGGRSANTPSWLASAFS